MCGGLAVISDVPKTLVYDLARYVNRRARDHPAVEHHEGAERRAAAESDRPGHAAAVRDHRSRNRGLHRARRGCRDDCALRARSRGRRGHRPQDHAQRVQAAAGGAGTEDHVEGIRRRPAVPHRRRTYSRVVDEARFARLPDRSSVHARPTPRTSRRSARHPLRPFAHRPAAPRPHRQCDLCLGHGAARSVASVRLRIEDHDRERSRAEFERGIHRRPRVAGISCPMPREFARAIDARAHTWRCARPPERRRPASTGATARARESRATPATSVPNCATTVIAAIAGWGPAPIVAFACAWTRATEVFDDARLGADPAGAGATSAAICSSATAVGNWTYQFAVTVDDLVDSVTLVIRGRGSPGVDRPADSARAAAGPGRSRRCSCIIRSCAARTARN